jgi:predicted nucleotidyltransferase
MTGAVMTEQDYAIASDLKQRLESAVSLLDFRIFGSRARGDADEHSDMDVFVEVELLDKNLKDRIMDISWEVGFENFMVIAPLIFSRDELENSPLRSSQIVKAIAAEGVPV